MKESATKIDHVDSVICSSVFECCIKNSFHSNQKIPFHKTNIQET